MSEASPGWYAKAKALFAAGGATVAGVSIWQNPEAWALAVVSDFIVGGVLALGQELGGIVILVNNQITGALGTSGGAVLDGFGLLAGSILDLYGLYAGIVATLAGAAGPFSFFVTIAGFGLAVFVGAIVVSALIRLVVVIS